MAWLDLESEIATEFLGFTPGVHEAFVAPVEKLSHFKLGWLREARKHPAYRRAENRRNAKRMAFVRAVARFAAESSDVEFWRARLEYVRTVKAERHSGVFWVEIATGVRRGRPPLPPRGGAQLKPKRFTGGSMRYAS